MTPADPVLLRTECILQDDSRLMAGVSAVILDAARRANLSESLQAALNDAVLRACRASFDVQEKGGEKAPEIHLVTTDFTDRVEATIDYSGEMAPEGGTSSGGVDLVSRFTRNGHSHVTLTKFSPSRNSQGKD